MMGRVDEAKEQLQWTLAIDPLNVPGVSTLAILLAHEGRVDEARAQFVRALKLSPNYVATLYYFAAFEAGQSNYSKSRELLQRALAIAPDFAGVRGALAFTDSQLGRSADAHRLLAEERSRVSNEGSPVKYGLALALAGKSDSAFATLRTAQWDIPTLIDLRVDPLLKTFRSDRRYPQLLAHFHLRP
jgi:tetratricopeptide (TPR) repeat protein